MTTKEPPWLTLARADIGVREIPGAPTAPRIAQWLQALGAWWRDDETPWCGTAVAAWMRASGIEPPKAWYRARAWADWGLPLLGPRVGCVVVLSRQGGGHVGLVVGVTPAGSLLVLGGNQGDAVSIAAFLRDRVVAYRWPWTAPLTSVGSVMLPISSAPASRSEA